MHLNFTPVSLGTNVLSEIINAARVANPERFDALPVFVVDHTLVFIGDTAHKVSQLAEVPVIKDLDTPYLAIGFQDSDQLLQGLSECGFRLAFMAVR